MKCNILAGKLCCDIFEVYFFSPFLDAASRRGSTLLKLKACFNQFLIKYGNFDTPILQLVFCIWNKGQ